MPFPWKKAKVTRITRIVADLQSPKRGGSLVVETGFPTSLIDLFVKNRDKLKRPTIKRRKKKNKPIGDGADPGLTGDIGVVADDPVAAGDSNAEAEMGLSPNVAVEAERSLAEKEGKMETETGTATGSARGAPEVFLAAIRVFTVAVLALSTKKLAVGVTLSAFVLLFLEFVGKILIVRLLTRPSGSKKEDDDDDDEEEEEEDYIAARELVSDGTDSRSSVEEIEVSETRNSKDGEVLRPDLELLGRDRKWGCSDANCEGQVLAVDKSKSNSKRAMIKRKIIKNFVPKKLRSYKKAKKPNFLDPVETLEEEAQEAHESRGIDVKEEEDAAISEDDEQEGRGREEENWVIVITIFAVVLLGLFGGRAFALLLTLVYCFGMKLIGIGTQRKSST